MSLKLHGNKLFIILLPLGQGDIGKKLFRYIYYFIIFIYYFKIVDIHRNIYNFVMN